MRQVSRTLVPGGHYALQEISITSDDLDPAFAKTMLRDIQKAVRHPAWPNSVEQWRGFLERHDFEIIEDFQRPVLLLEPERLLEDEGVEQALKFSWNVLDNDVAIRRVREIRAVFKQYRKHLCGYAVVCRKK